MNQRAETAARRILWFSILATVSITPLLVAPTGRDLFRAPKAAFFEAAMLLIAAGCASWFLLGRTSARSLIPYRRPMIVAVSAVLWATVVTLTAVNPDVSRFAPLTALACAAAFIGTLALAEGTLLPLAALLVPAAINAVSVALQDLGVWSPVRLPPTAEARVNTTGLLGNPDYVAAYLIVPCVAALCGAVAFRRHRPLFTATLSILLCGVLFTRSVTGMVAVGAALIAFAFVSRSRAARVAVFAALAVFVVAVAAYAPTRNRAHAMLRDAKGQRWMEVFSYRLPAFAAALSMFQDRPLVGVGPGGYEARYMSYKLANDERFPQWINLGNVNFGEAHNDHLQLLAETGFPGLALFLVALAQIAALSFRKEAETERGRYSRLFGLPAATGFGVVALAQFPLHLTACTATAVFAAGLALAWRDATDQELPPEAEAPQRFTGKARMAAVVVAACAVTVSFVAAYRVGWLRYRAEVVKKRAEERLYQEFTSDHYARARVARNVAAELEPFLRNNPFDYQTLFFMAVAAEDSERKPLALEFYRKALALNERPEIYSNMAILQFELGEVEEARRNMTRAAIFNLPYVYEVSPSLQAEIIQSVHDRLNRLQQQANDQSRRP